MTKIDNNTLNALSTYNENEIKSFLDTFLTIPGGKNIIKAHFKELFLSGNDVLFKMIFIPKYGSLFDEAITINFPFVLRTIVQKNNPEFIKLLTYSYREKLLKYQAYLLIDNPKYDLYLYKLFDILGESCYIWNRDSFLKHMVDIPKIYEDLSARFINLIIFISTQDPHIIDENIKVIVDVLTNTIDAVLQNKIVYPPDKQIVVLKYLIKVAKKRPIFEKILDRRDDLLISLFTSTSFDALKKDGLLDFFFLLLKQIKSEEHASISDFKVECGASSTVLIVGCRVIKIRFTEIEEVPYDPCLLRPLIRTNLYDLHDNLLYGLEIFDRVATDNIDEEVSYQMFRDALNRGTFLADCASRNTGILLHKNVPYLKGATRYDEEGKSNGEYDVRNEDIKIKSSGIPYETFPEGSYVHFDYEDIHNRDTIDFASLLEKYKDSPNVDIAAFNIYSEICQILGWQVTPKEFIERYVREKLQELPRILEIAPTKKLKTTKKPTKRAK